MPTAANMPIRVVFYREDDRWIAHCLEFDLVGDGDTRREATDSLADAIGVQVKESLGSGNLANLFSPAPAEYWRKFAQGRHVADDGLDITLRDDGVDIPAGDFRDSEEIGSDPRLAAAS